LYMHAGLQTCMQGFKHACRASNNTIKDAVLPVQSYTVAVHLYAVSIAHGVL